MIIKNKKGQIFTLIAIALIVLMFVTIEIYSHFRDQDAIRNRVKSMDSFLQALEKNLNRQAYTTGVRIIFLGLSERLAKGIYVGDLQSFIEEAYFQGTVGGVPHEIMNGATLGAMLTAINDKARKINVNISVVSTNITMSQDDPWFVKFVISSDFVMEDLQGLASWNKTQNITAYIPISLFEDPLYLKNAGGAGRKINQTPYEGEYNVSGDVTNLSLHMENAYFATNPGAPSFLGRLTGNLGPDTNGIESFVNIGNLTTTVLDYFDPGTRDESVIDYLFFDETDDTLGSAIVGINSKFKIDDGHRLRYQLSL